MKTVGLIGGMSWESTALYYQLLNQGIRKRLGGLHSARILMASVDFEEIEQMQRQSRWEEAGVVLADLGSRLEHAGADCILLCTNTMHKVAPQIEAALSVPFLHLADATARVVQEKGFERVGLLGTSFTMEEDFFRGRLVGQGLDVLVPEPGRRNEIDRVIFDELCCGQVLAESRKMYLQTIQDLATCGAQAVILGCTEIGLLVPSEKSSIPLVDTTSVHVAAAIEWILS